LRRSVVLNESEVRPERTHSFHLADLHGLENRFGRTDKIEGTIRLTCVTAYAHRVLAPLVAEFTALYPGVEFEVEPTDQLIDLIDNQMDLGIRVEKPHGSDFVFIKLVENRLLVCASPAYLKRIGHRPRQPQDLHEHSVLMLARGGAGHPLRMGCASVA
jgi:DNA-binding transcriptional LysR family regulator